MRSHTHMFSPLDERCGIDMDDITGHLPLPCDYLMDALDVEALLKDFELSRNM